ncbi:MAG: COX15/CtaA family protein [Pseudomonadota bacterium]
MRLSTTDPNKSSDIANSMQWLCAERGFFIVKSVSDAPRVPCKTRVQRRYAAVSVSSLADKHWQQQLSNSVLLLLVLKMRTPLLCLQRRLCSTALMSRSFVSQGRASRSFASQEVGRRQLSSPSVGENRAVGYWLLGCGGMVGGMVCVGGLTRLTRSGLSMTDWKLQGSLPPLTQSDWEREFERYKQYPEWEQRRSMDIDEFKAIYWWEYAHRMAGRAVGLCFVGPLIYFGVRGQLPSSIQPQLAVLFGLGGTQGFVGWWMVKSGLDEGIRGQKKEIRVSPYRLATHLGLAFTTYSLLLWTALDVLSPPTTLPRHAAIVLRPVALASCCVVFATALSGAFVAGNDAGRAFNTFPTMDGQWFPDGLTQLQPAYRNLAENTATVQFVHRLLAATSTASVLGLASAALPIWLSLPLAIRQALALAGLALTAQVSLGISTLLLYVPIPLAAAHQVGSLFLLTTLLKTAHLLRPASVSLTAQTTTGIAAVGCLPFALFLSSASAAACHDSDEVAVTQHELDFN